LFKILLVSILLLFCIHGKAQQIQNNDSLVDKLNTYLISAANAGKFNGSVLIAKKGVIILQKGYGYKDFSAKKLNDKNTIFQICSFTKSFTAMVILKLQEEGKLSVNDHLNRYFPGQKDADKITIQNLLDHTSGMANYTDVIGPEDSAIISHPVTRQRVLDIFIQKSVHFKPGSKFEYCNSGYYLLGIIIEKLSGMPYDKAVRRLILSPLRMTHTGFDFINLNDTSKAIGYVSFNKNEHSPAVKWDSTVTYSAGAIYSTVGDLYRWGAAIAKGEILSKDSWKQAFAPNLENYGDGWWIDSLYRNKYITHSGGIQGFMSNFIYYPDSNVTIILLNNFGNYGQSLWGVNMGLSAIMFNKPYANWVVHTESNIDETALKQYAGKYIYNKQHSLIITFENGKLYVEATNPKDKLPKVQLHADDKGKFYITEANLGFDFVKGDNNNYKIVTYNNGSKDAEWIKK